MISRDPDLTRLLDRLDKRGLITRQRQTQDRRVLKTRTTPEGLMVFKKLDQPVRELHKNQFRQLRSARLKQLGERFEPLLNRAGVGAAWPSRKFDAPQRERRTKPP